MELFEGDTQQIGAAVGLLIMMIYLGFQLFRKK
jgi:hypothetical protein